MELLSAASESEYNDISKTTSNSGHKTDIEQGNELEMNKSSSSISLPSFIKLQYNLLNMHT